MRNGTYNESNFVCFWIWHESKAQSHSNDNCMLTVFDFMFKNSTFSCRMDFIRPGYWFSNMWNMQNAQEHRMHRTNWFTWFTKFKWIVTMLVSTMWIKFGRNSKFSGPMALKKNYSWMFFRRYFRQQSDLLFEICSEWNKTA